MKKTFLLYTGFLLAIVFGSISCNNTNTDTVATADKDSVKIEKKINYSQILLDEIVKRGDFINSENAPTLISAVEVNSLLDSNILVVDLRGNKAYSEGHIKGAIQLKYKEILDYFQVKGIPEYDKVVMVCYTGQTASYAASVLQLSGYKNVYAMSMGMCSWNKKFSKKRIAHSSDKLIKKIDKRAKAKNEKTKLPELKCHTKSGVEILNQKAKDLLNAGYKAGAITIDQIISSPGRFYIVNYVEPEVYELGHLKGAVQYTPGKSLSLNTDLLTLPPDKIIVVYTASGELSAYVVAYLRMLGYDAQTLKYGANSFMNSLMLENNKMGTGFDEKLINNFETETSEYIEEVGGVQDGGC